jgi:hypothetical protein
MNRCESHHDFVEEKILTKFPTNNRLRAASKLRAKRLAIERSTLTPRWDAIRTTPWV